MCCGGMLCDAKLVWKLLNQLTLYSHYNRTRQHDLDLINTLMIQLAEEGLLKFHWATMEGWAQTLKFQERPGAESITAETNNGALCCMFSYNMSKIYPWDVPSRTVGRQLDSKSMVASGLKTDQYWSVVVLLHKLRVLPQCHDRFRSFAGSYSNWSFFKSFLGFFSCFPTTLWILRSSYLLKYWMAGFFSNLINCLKSPQNSSINTPPSCTFCDVSREAGFDVVWEVCS